MRQSRSRRHRGVNIRLTERDHHVLEVLGRFRVAKTTDLLLSCFRGVHPMTGRMRLRRLFDGGFLHLRSGVIGQESLYALGPKAQQWKLGNVPRGPIEHHLGIVRAWSLLASGAAARGLEIELARPDWELREEVSGSEIIPDLFMVFSGIALAVEVDRGTEPLGVLARKMRTYASLDRLFGYPFVVSVMADRRIPGAHVWSEEEGPGSCYELLLLQQEAGARK